MSIAPGQSIGPYTRISGLTPLDLAAEAVRFTLENTQDWHFVLSPSLETSQEPAELESGLLERASALRERIHETRDGSRRSLERLSSCDMRRFSSWPSD